jgi:hypothetical protein
VKKRNVQKVKSTDLLKENVYQLVQEKKEKEKDKVMEKAWLNQL